MWRSRVIAARSFRSVHTNAVTRVPHSISGYSPQLHSQVTLVSNNYSKSFRSLSNNTVRFFSSSVLDSVTDNVASVSTNTNNDKNDSCSVVDSEQFEKVVHFLSNYVLVDDDEDGADCKYLEPTLDEMNLDLSEEFMTRLFKEWPSVSAENMVAFYHWAIHRKNQPVFSATTRSLDDLINVVGPKDNGNLEDTVFGLWELIKEIGEKTKGVVTTEILNELMSKITSYGGEDTDAFEVFDKFGDFSCEPNETSYFHAIESVCSPALISDPVGQGRVRKVCERLITEGKLMKRAVGDMICSLCNAGMAKEAHSFYLLAKEKQITPPMVDVKNLFYSLCYGNEIDSDSVCLGLNMMHEIYGGDERKYDIKQFSCVIQALCEVDALEGAVSLLTNMNDNVPPPGNAVYSTVINYVVKSGDMAEAVKVMRIMEERGLKPDLFTYSEIMSGYIKGGEIENAMKMFSEAKKSHGNLTPDIYHMFISVYCRLKKFEKAVKLLEEMEEFGIEPNTDEYDELITSVCLKALKATDYGIADKLMAKMTKRGLHLNGLRKAVAI